MTKYEFIYFLGPGHFARGRAGERATHTVKAVKDTNGLFRHPGVYKGVRARKPLIPVDAGKLSRRTAGPDLCRALGLEHW